ncbi:hypothetical protein K438DRAFT_1968526 [Mycena galopus ATCC 62051]|nr:hypothetical protein K438DRAFT_1968526 [Mycena galopus ATCC 62051]
MSEYLDLSRCVLSRQGVYYWRPDMGSRWRGEPDDRVWVPGLDWPDNAPIPPDPQYSRAPPSTRSSPRQRTENRRLHESRDYDTPPRYDTVPQSPSGFAETRPQPPPVLRGGFGSSRDRDIGPYAGRSLEFRSPVVDHEVPYWAHHACRVPSRHGDLTPTRSLLGSDITMDPAFIDARLPGATMWMMSMAAPMALRSKPVRPAVAATCAVPLVENAAVDAEGYPIFPLSAPTNDDESDYGGSDTDTSGDEGDKVQRDIANKERIQLEDAQLNRSPRPTLDALPPPPAAAGPWGRLNFDTVARAKLITQWWRAGCGRADTMIKHLVRVYGQYPLLRRPPGILYLMRHLRDGNTDFLLARGNRGLHANQPPRRSAAVRRNEDLSTTTDTTTTDVGLTGDELMPPAPPALGHTQSYIGFSPVPANSSRDVLGPHAPLNDVIDHYTQLPPAQWARGVRDDQGYWPAPSAAAGVSPHIGDVLHSSCWRDMVLNAFSVRGLFERHVAIGGWVGGFAILERYPFDTLNMSLSDALQWVHAHGIPADSDASRTIHAYTASWRNMREGGADSRNVDFAGEYPSPATTWAVDRITPWPLIRHGTLRVGASSEYPQAPGAVPAEEDSEMRPAEEGELSEGLGDGDASLALSSSASRPSKKDKKAKEGKLRNSECKPLSGDNSNSLEVVTPTADVPCEPSKVKTAGMGDATLSSWWSPLMMTTKLNTGGESGKRPADNTAPAESLPKKKSRQASDNDIIEEVPAPKPKGKDKKKNASVHPTTGGKKPPPAAAKKGTEPTSKNAKPLQRILWWDEAIPVVLSEHLQLQSKPQHADSWELDNPIFPKTKMAEVIRSLPKYNKERLPLDKDSVYYTLSFRDLIDLLAVTPAVDGPRCTACLSCGSFCDSVGFPLQCKQCDAHHDANSCNLAFSDEINNDLVSDLKLWVKISSGSKPIRWRDQMQELGASSRQVEMADRTRQLALNNHHFNILRLLHVIVCTRRSITHQEFVARFAGEAPETQDFNSEYFLQLAMLQGIRADIEPIPVFGSAYDFYDSLEDVANPQRPLGFYMIPANPEANIEPVWVPLQVDDFEVTVSGGTKISCGT